VRAADATFCDFHLFDYLEKVGSRFSSTKEPILIPLS